MTTMQAYPVKTSKNKQHKLLCFGQEFLEQDLLKEAHSVRTFLGEIYINLNNGKFISQKDPARIKSLDVIYRSAKTVMNSQRTVIAKRLKSYDQVIEEMTKKKSYSEFQSMDTKLRRVTIKYK